MRTLEEINIALDRLLEFQEKTAIESEKSRIEAEKSRVEAEKSRQEYEIRSKKTEAYINNIGKQVGGLGEKFGYFTEGMALPTMEKILEKEFFINTVTPRFKRKFSPTKTVEYDVFGYCNGIVNNAVIVEIKSKLESKHVYELIDELNEFKTLFPEYKDKHLFGILAVVDIGDKDAINLATENGIYFARITDNIFTMQPNPNAKDFNL